jgi:hypothetical protein
LAESGLSALGIDRTKADINLEQSIVRCQPDFDYPAAAKLPSKAGSPALA